MRCFLTFAANDYCDAQCVSQMPRVIKGIMPSHVDALTHHGFNLLDFTVL